MTALGWVRGKATLYSEEVMAVSPEEGAAAGCEPGNYQVKRWKFAGRVGYRMAMELREQAAQLVRNDTEQETLRTGGQYRSEIGNVEYFRTTYQFIG